MIDQCQLFMSLVPRTNPRFLLTVSAVVILILSACSGDSHSDIEPRQLQARWLWDPTSTSLEDWQIIGRSPQDIIIGEPGELLVSDNQNKRIIRFSTDGNLIEVIGQSGEGPGEFRDNMDLSYDTEGRILWVAERGFRAGLISRFTLVDNRFRFLDIIRSQAIRQNRVKCLVHEGTESFWTVYFIADDLSRESLIKLYNRDDELVRSFGRLRLTESEGHSGNFVKNDGHLLRADGDRLAYIWYFQPIVEIWDTNGTLLVERIFDTPEIQQSESQQLQSRGPLDYFSVACWYPARDLLYVGFNTVEPHRFVVYGLSPTDLSIVEYYQLEQSEEEEERFRFFGLAPEEYDGQMRFFSLDRNTSGVVVLELIP